MPTIAARYRAVWRRRWHEWRVLVLATCGCFACRRRRGLPFRMACRRTRLFPVTLLADCGAGARRRGGPSWLASGGVVLRRPGLCAAGPVAHRQDAIARRTEPARRLVGHLAH